MKVLQINNCHYRRGGADIVYLNTGELFEKNGHQVIYFSSLSDKNIPSSSSNYFVKEVAFIDTPLYKKLFYTFRFMFSLEAMTKLDKLITIEKPDIAHIHLYKGTLTPSILYILKKRNIPTVITLHDYGLLCPHNLLIDGEGSICEKCNISTPLHCITNKCNRNSIILSVMSALDYMFHSIIFPFHKYLSTIICVSDFALRKHNSVEHLKNKTVHIYNFFPQQAAPTANLKKGTYFLYIGRLSKEKGLNTLVNAWNKKQRSSELLIAGTGPLYDEISTLIKQSNANIRLIGFKQGDDLINLVRNASFIIVPSEWYENNPLTVVEAYSHGKPVIGTDVDGITEIIHHNKTGYLFSMKNAEELSEIIELCENISADKYMTLSIAARKFAEDNFSEDCHYKRLLGLYKEIIDSIQKSIK